MQKCYEYFDCKQTECVMFESKETRACWEVDTINCHNDGIEGFGKITPEAKKKLCEVCQYYKEMNGDEKKTDE